MEEDEEDVGIAAHIKSKARCIDQCCKMLQVLCAVGRFSTIALPLKQWPVEKSVSGECRHDAVALHLRCCVSQ